VIKVEAGMSASAQRRWIKQEVAAKMKSRYISVYLIGNICPQHVQDWGVLRPSTAH
jgi:hypothetical protein